MADCSNSGAATERSLLDAASVDLLVCAFSTALHHFRRASVALPFPRVCRTASGEKDYNQCTAIIDTLPRSTQQLHAVYHQPKKYAADAAACSPSNDRGAPLLDSDLASWWCNNNIMSSQQSQLLRWLIGGLHMMQLCTADVWRRQLPQLACCQVQTLQPNLVFTVERQPTTATAAWQQDSNGWVLAYHGTNFENVHSILHQGLQPASGTKLQRNGAIFGNGIYLAKDHVTAFGFAASQPVPWRGSNLGSRLRVVLVCKVDIACTQRQNKVPDSYIVCGHPSEVCVQYVLLYIDAPPLPLTAAHKRHTNWCTLLVLMYAAVLGLLWFWRSLPQQTKKALLHGWV